MHLLHFILLVLLGLLAPSAASVPGQTATGSVGQDLDRAVGNDLAARQGYPSELLLTYKLKCALDPKTEKAPNYKGTQGRKGTKFLKDSFCRRYWKCLSDGTIDYNRDWRFPRTSGCVDPTGGTVQGSYGSVSRDTDLAPVDDGFVMEGFEGPPRKA
ncbi:hypothetical protein LA080_010992 [Diaporthe eres]|nr:hypothetical protein LA080_010992 [Diaporthe eres]